jgi:hypothetical protein
LDTYVKQPSAEWRERCNTSMLALESTTGYVRECAETLGFWPVMENNIGVIVRRVSDPKPFTPREIVELAGALRGLQTMLWCAGKAGAQEPARLRASIAAMKALQPLADELERLFPDEGGSTP